MYSNLRRLDEIPNRLGLVGVVDGVFGAAAAGPNRIAKAGERRRRFDLVFLELQRGPQDTVNSSDRGLAPRCDTLRNPRAFMPLPRLVAK